MTLVKMLEVHQDFLHTLLIASFPRAEAELVAAGICVNTTDDAACKDFVPDFWKAIAREMYPGAWGHLCDDIAVRRHFT